MLLPYPFAGAFDYACPAPSALEPGDVVLVPLNRRAEVGVVWDPPDGLPADLLAPGAAPVPDNKLKPVSALLDVPRMPASLRRFVDWVAGYTLAPPGLVLAMALRINAAQALPVTTGWVRSGSNSVSVRSTPARARVLQALADGVPRGTAELARMAGVGAGVVRGMAEAGLLREQEIAAAAPFGQPDPDHVEAALSADQARVAAQLRGLGAGKAVPGGAARRRHRLGQDRNLPGSGGGVPGGRAPGAGAAAGDRACPRNGCSASAAASGWSRRCGIPTSAPSAVASPGARSPAARRAVVVGARSALFLPFPDLGLVIVDEEHETAFKQEDGVTYHARDMAVVRARLAEAPVLLVSATPSLETLANVESGRYRHLSLTARHGGARLPEVAPVDLRDHPPERGRFLSPPLIEAVADTLHRAEQAMLFLNRRGYAPLTLCRACGHRIQCPNCTAWLVEHRARRQLACHHCGHNEAVPVHCPSCRAENSLTPIGPGVERITEEARATFPDARILVMASDTLPGPNAAAEAVRRIADREVDLVIGTQIVAKGWHFPGLTLVGVVDADLGLAGGDLRAAERTVQLLHQVAGRAGRAEQPGRVLLQTYSPEHPVMQALAAGDFARFMEREAEQRRPGHWPPFGRLAALIVSADTAEAADQAAAALGRSAPTGEGLQVLGPAPAPLAILRGRHRRRLLLRTRRDVAVQPILRHWMAAWRALAPTVPRSVQVDVDVDPVSFL